jgi:hypothetical protein
MLVNISNYGGKGQKEDDNCETYNFNSSVNLRYKYVKTMPLFTSFQHRNDKDLTLFLIVFNESAALISTFQIKEDLISI